MKNLIIVCCLLMVANSGFSQIKKNLQGPAAKNAKPWQKKSKKTPIVYNHNKEFLKGPVAKNVKPWQKETSSQVYVEVQSGKQHNLKGPRAKNLKPWMLPKSKNIEAIVEKTKSKDAASRKLATE